jgi:3-oxoacyl-[acyl-carrier-protein] synthase III
MTYVHLTSWGMAVPQNVLTNADLERVLDTSDEWIVNRTGIRQRHIASAQESTSSLATQAACEALSEAHLTSDRVDLIIVATSTPDHIVVPSTACLIQDNLKAERASAFDLTAACSGFIYGLACASQAIRSGDVQTALVIGADLVSRHVNWADRATCVLFGDGAGAVLLQANDQPGGLLTTVTGADGSGRQLLEVAAGGSALPTTIATLTEGLQYVRMNGKSLFRAAVEAMVHAAHDALQRTGLSLYDISLIIPHQANRRIIEAVARTLGTSLDKFFINIDRYGNTSAASIPIALYEAAHSNYIQPNDHILLISFGGGLTWGASIIRWTQHCH